VVRRSAIAWSQAEASRAHASAQRAWAQPQGLTLTVDPTVYFGYPLPKEPCDRFFWLQRCWLANSHHPDRPVSAEMATTAFGAHRGRFCDAQRSKIAGQGFAFVRIDATVTDTDHWRPQRAERLFAFAPARDATAFISPTWRQCIIPRRPGSVTELCDKEFTVLGSVLPETAVHSGDDFRGLSSQGGRPGRQTALAADGAWHRIAR
jgi:hypothetical protein